MQMQPIPASQIPPQYSAQQTNSNTQPTSTGYGIASLICGIISLLLPLIGVFFAVAAIILFFLQKNKGGTTGSAMGGLICGCIGLLIIPLMFVGALAYFGVLDPSKMLPDKCILGSGVGACIESAIQENNIMFQVNNAIGQDVTITKLSAIVTGIRNPCNPTVTAEQMQWKSGSENTMTISGCQIESGERVQAQLSLEYIRVGSQLARTIQGEITMRKN